MFQGRNRFNADNGIRGGNPNPDQTGDASIPQRASFGSEQNPSAAPQQVLSSAPAGNPHSSSGFRRALERTTRTQNRLTQHLPNKTSFGGGNFRKPNYAFQGGGRHGMHIGTGGPFTGPATGEGGSDFGGGN